MFSHAKSVFRTPLDSSNSKAKRKTLPEWLAASRKLDLTFKRVGKGEYVGTCPLEDCKSNTFYLNQRETGAWVSCESCIDPLPKERKSARFVLLLRLFFPEKEAKPKPAAVELQQQTSSPPGVEVFIDENQIRMNCPPGGRFGAGDIGQYFAMRIGGTASGKFAFNEDTQQWWRSTSTHWKRCQLEDVLGELHSFERLKVLNEIEENYITGDKKKDALWLDLQEQILDPVWGKSTFRNALRYWLKRQLPEPPLHEFATPDGILVVTKDESKTRFFRPKTDGFKACLPTMPADNSDAFESLLKQWIPNDETRLYTQRMIGGAMLGLLDRRYLMVIGRKGSGKTAFMNALQTTVGPLGYMSNRDMWNPKGNHNIGLVDLIERQCRLVFLPEVHKTIISGDVINELTGDEKHAARRPNDKENTEGYITATPIFYGEHPPKVFGMTLGTLDRQVVIPFGTGKNWPDNYSLKKKMKDPQSDEVKSCMTWLLHGMRTFLHFPTMDAPAPVIKASREILAEQDEVLDWLLNKEDTLHTKTTTEIRELFLLEGGPEAVSLKAIGAKLGFLNENYRGRKAGGSMTWYWVGPQ